MLAPLDGPILPELDAEMGAAWAPDDGWPATSRRFWEAWRIDPVTQTWNTTDVALALDTLRLHAVEPVKRAGEVRVRLDTLALTPKGRRDARLLLPVDEPESPPEPTFAENVRELNAHRRLPEAK